jgi:hypothetical protein
VSQRRAPLSQTESAKDSGHYHHERPHSRLRWMSPAIYAVARRSAALRSTDGSAPRTAAIIAQRGVTDRQTPIAAG